MADPTGYDRDYSFSGFQANAPATPLPGQQVDIQLDKVSASITTIVDAIRDVRRPDGKLRNGIVTAESLSPDLVLGFRPPAEWQAGVEYKAGDTVFVDVGFYRALVDHVSTDFAVNLAAGLWELFADMSQVMANADIQALLDKISNTHGAVLCRGASGWEALAPGDQWKVLTSMGAGAVPQWVDNTPANNTVTDDKVYTPASAGDPNAVRASKLSFLQAGTDAVYRTVQDKLRERISLLDFIPESEHAAILAYTSTYDATAAINSAYAQAKAVRGTLWCPSGLYNVSSTITLDGQASIIGEGGIASNLDMEPVTDKAMTLFRWVGAAGGTVFNQTGRIGAIDIGNFAVDCNNLADIGIRFDRLRRSRIFGVMVVKWRANQVGTAGILIKPQPTYPHDNFMHNDIGPLYLRGPTCCLRLAEMTPVDGVVANVCHNTFRQLFIDARGGTTNYGMVIEDADNNTFWMTHTFLYGGTGNFAVVHEAASRSNYFFHFQGSMWAKAGSKNAVFGYDQENGQPEPTVDPGAELFWTENGRNARRWNMTSMLRGVCVEQQGDWTPGTTPWADMGAFKHYRPDIGGLAGWTFKNSPRRYDLWVTTGGSSPSNVMSFGNDRIGFFGAQPKLKPTVTGSRGGNAALQSLLTALADLGLITNSTTD